MGPHPAATVADGGAQCLVKDVVQHQPFICNNVAFTALEFPVKGRMEEWLHPGIHLQ